MRKMIALALALALLQFSLSGCATPALYGNFLHPSATLDQQRLAGEAVKQLSALYPPAKTRLELQQDTPDVFGATLVKALREQGYALVEFAPELAKAQVSATTTSVNQKAPAA